MACSEASPTASPDGNNSSLGSFNKFSSFSTTSSSTEGRAAVTSSPTVARAARDVEPYRGKSCGDVEPYRGKTCGGVEPYRGKSCDDVEVSPAAAPACNSRCKRHALEPRKRQHLPATMDLGITAWFQGDPSSICTAKA